MKTKFLAAIAISLLTGASGVASTTINYQFVAPELEPGTRCLLVASTFDTDFGDPAHLAGVRLQEGQRFGKDEVVLAVLMASELGGGLSGCAGALSVTYGGALGAGDPLRLIWLPDLNADATMIPLGTEFESYRTDSAEDGGTIGYVLPADGSTQSIHSIADVYGGDLPTSRAVPAEVVRFDPVADSDSDRIPDLTEFAMGLDPFEPTPLHLAEIRLVPDGDDLRIRFPRRADFWEHGIEFVVEASSDLGIGSWTEVDRLVDEAASTTTATGEGSMRLGVGTSEAGFLRLRILQEN